MDILDITILIAAAGLVSIGGALASARYQSKKQRRAKVIMPVAEDR